MQLQALQVSKSGLLELKALFFNYCTYQFCSGYGVHCAGTGNECLSKNNHKEI